jgi:hypothetical protein
MLWQMLGRRPNCAVAGAGGCSDVTDKNASLSPRIMAPAQPMMTPIAYKWRFLLN